MPSKPLDNGRISGGAVHLTQTMRLDASGHDPDLAPALTIRLFGGMAMHDADGADLMPRSRKTRAIVAALALIAPKPMQRGQITALLWSRRENEQARASLRQAIHELQDLLRPNLARLLLAGRHTVALDLTGVEVDAIRASQPGAPRTELLALFRGGFLEDLIGLDQAFDAWLLKERQRLQTIARLGGETYLRDRHAAPDTVVITRDMLRIDRAHDGAWRALIEAHLDIGDRSAARAAYEQWVEVLGFLAGAEPPPEAADLLSRIKSGAMSTRPREATGYQRSSLATVAEATVLPNYPVAGQMPRPRLRLGVREMRIIGADIDCSLPAGLAEEITTAMARCRWISCVSGGWLPPSIANKSDSGPMVGVEDQLSPDWPDQALDLILDGTIRRGDEKVRVTARLLDLRARGTVIWTSRFDHDLDDALSLQDAIAAAIVAQIDPVLLMREGELAARAPIGATPMEMVMRAVPAIYRLDRISFHSAGELLEAALRVDPNNVDALAWFAYWHLFLVGQGWANDPDAAVARAGTLADSAVAVDPNDARALTLAGHVRGFLFKRASEAQVLHERAISLNPNLALAWCFSGFAASYLGDHALALERMGQAIQLSPSDPHLFFFRSAVMMPHLARGEYHEAATAGRKAIELNPWFSSSFKGYLSALGHLGLTQEAEIARSRLLKLEPNFNVRVATERSPMMVRADVERYSEGLRRAGLPEE
jgi:DNA-binding SARP family transcriptional activator/TolB-like protein